MKYFYATYNYNVHEVFDRKETSSHKFYENVEDLPWDKLLERLGYLYTKDNIDKNLREKGSFMSGQRGGSIMIIDLKFNGSFKRSTGKDVYEAAMKKMKPILRELKIDNLI